MVGGIEMFEESIVCMLVVEGGVFLGVVVCGVGNDGMSVVWLRFNIGVFEDWLGK